MFHNNAIHNLVNTLHLQYKAIQQFNIKLCKIKIIISWLNKIDINYNIIILFYYCKH